MANQIRICYRLWAEVDDQPFFGKGRADLLRHIMEHGSITKAAKAMGMSYKKAWDLVASMNALSDKPYVEKKLGGKAGGGAIVTPEGKRAIRQFEQLLKKMDSLVARAQQQFKV